MSKYLHFSKRQIVFYTFLFLFLHLITIVSASDSLSAEKIYKIGLPYVPGVMWRSGDQKVHGFPLELFEQIANQEGIKYEWVEGTWPALYNKVIKGEIDALPATQVTDERKKQLDFLEHSLYTMWSELYINENTVFTGISDLANKKIALVQGDNNAIGFEEYISDFEINYTKVFLSSHIEGVKMLENNEIYALVGPSYHMTRGWSKAVKRTHLYFNPTSLSISFPKGKNEHLRKTVDACLYKFKSNPQSSYNQLYTKYKLASFNEPIKELPYWVQILLPIIFITLILGIIFLLLLKKQVRQKTQNLKQREFHLRQTMELGSMGTWIVDVSTWTINWSPELFDILGFKEPSKITFQTIRKLIHPDDLIKVSSIFFNSIKKGENFELECRILRNDGAIVYTKQIGLFYNDEDGKVAKVIGILQNITQQKNRQHMLVEAKEKAEESERLKSAFLANMSHEIRTPLNAIVGFSGLLGRTDLDSDKKKQFLTIVEKQNNLLLGLINDMIDFAKIESKSLVVKFSDNVDLGALILDVYETFKPHCPDSVDFILKDFEPTGKHLITTDVVRLKQVINNLIINAFKYTQEGVVEIGYRTNNIDQQLEIYVKDTGEGIPEEHKKRIFDRFHQVNTMSQGTGLGLAICKALSTMLGGDIQYKATEHKGAEFTVVLPFSKVNLSEKNLYPSSMFETEIDVSTLDLSEVSILIAEDNPANLLFMDTILTDKNAITKHASNGVEAVELTKVNDFDLILMDIKMPQKDGLTATKEIKSFKPNLPVIAVTAFAFDADRSKALNAGCTDYISKPVDKEELYELISLVLNQEYNKE